MKKVYRIFWSTKYSPKFYGVYEILIPEDRVRVSSNDLVNAVLVEAFSTQKEANTKLLELTKE